jgi:hypothetical protein
MRFPFRIMALAAVALALSAPAFAQYGGRSSPFADAKFNAFLSNHPGISQKLQQNPRLLYNADFRNAHPDLTNFLNNHPNVWRSLQQEEHAVKSGVGRGWGAYDQQRQWRDSQWWWQNNPTWARQNHPEWWQGNGPFAGQRGWGDYDQQHRWRDAQWWRDHNPDWVRKNHPEWWQEHKAAIEQKHAEQQQWKAQKEAQKPKHHHGGPDHYQGD